MNSDYDGKSLLGRMLSPTSTEYFFDRFWERTHLHVSGDVNPNLSRYISGLVSLDDIDEVLTKIYTAGPRRRDSVRLGRNGTLVPPSEFLTLHGDNLAEVDLDRVASLYRAGSSVIINRVHETVPPIGELCDRLARFFGVHVHANIYITPPHGQGFPLHSDSHDVFLLQVEGYKEWTLYEASGQVPNAVSVVPMYGQPPQESVKSELRLRAGELLYLPRGVLHRGKASKLLSVHVTIGVTPYSWSDLFRDLLDDFAADDVELRRSVSPRLALSGDSPEKMRKTLRSLSDRLFSVEHANIVTKKKVDRAIPRGVRSRGGRVTKVFRSSQISSLTRVCVRDDVNLDIGPLDGRLAVTFNGKTLTLPRYTESHVRALCSGKETCAAELPSGLDEKGRLVLLRKFLHEGLLTVIDE